MDLPERLLPWQAHRSKQRIAQIQLTFLAKMLCDEPSSSPPPNLDNKWEHQVHLGLKRNIYNAIALLTST
jgi:hypothetical protein